MIRSMTGFGAAVIETRSGSIRAELKTVNHRYFSANLRLPAALERYEPQVREWLREYLPRGHISFSIRIERADQDGTDTVLRLDEARARQYLNALRSLKERFELPGEVDVALLSRFGDLFVRDEEQAAEVDLDDLRAVTEAAARDALAMREEEGRKLKADMEERLQAIETALNAIAERAPARLVAERDRMRRVVTELREGIPVDEERIARELALLAERWDISEEMVRLRSHVQRCREILNADTAEPAGKRLGFLNQEMHREANTIGSEANDAQIEHLVVDMKNEIERLREQIENVE